MDVVYSVKRTELTLRPGANVESKLCQKKGVTKSRLNFRVVANVEPLSILSHKLHFIKTQE